MFSKTYDLKKSKLQVPHEDLIHASKYLVNALRLRENYMAKSRQSFPQITSRYLSALDDPGKVPKKETHHHDEKKTIDGKFYYI